MTELGEGEDYPPLVEHRMDRTGLVAKLDKGFEPGVYCLYVEYWDLARRIGFTDARRLALGYCSLLRGQLEGMTGFSLDELNDASESDDPRRRRDLESRFLSSGIRSEDGRWHDGSLKKQFKLALLRAAQEWDQSQARAGEERREIRRERFRQRLDELLQGPGYRRVDAATKERLLAEVPDLAFPARGHGL